MSLPLLRRIALVIVTVTAAVAVTGLDRLQLNSHYTAYFDNSDPLLVAHEAISDLYARDDGLFVILQSNESFLTSENYQLLELLTGQLSAQDFSTRAVSITELGVIGDTFSADGGNIPSFQQLKENGQALGLLISDSLNTAGIWVQFELPDNHSLTILETVESVRELVISAIGDTSISAHYTGTLALNEAYIKVVQHDLKLIVPLLLLVATLILSQLLRTGWAVLAMLPVGICAVVAAFGLAGLFDAELTAITSFTPIIIFSISMAGCVHMVHSYVHYRDGGRPANDAALDAANYNWTPMLLANGTTALGFLGLTLSPSPPVRVVGLLVATGIVVSFILCMTFLPSVLARFDPWKTSSNVSSVFLDKLAKLVTQGRLGLIVLFLALSIPAVWFTSQNVISDNVFEYFPSSHTLQQDTLLVETELSGVNEVLYSVETGYEFGLFDAGVVNGLGRFAKWLSQQPEVNRVVSIADSEVIKEAQLEGRLQERLDFYRNHLDDTGSQNPLLKFAVSADFSSSLVSAYLAPMDSAELTQFDHKVHTWATEHLQGSVIRSGGPALMFGNLGQQNIRSMLTALSAALFVAALVLGVVFRSKRIAWIGVICNFLPILFVYSVWALVSGQISIGAAVVMGMVLGIVLDDTVYFLSSYQNGVRSELPDPVRYALHRVGPALIVTSITLIAGLSMGLLSDFGPIWSMSVLSVSIIAAALAVDLLLLPALVATSNIRGVTT